MINYIICDDNETFANKVKLIVEKYMMNFDIEPKYYIFKDYGEKFKNIINKIEGFKVYILDIETQDGSGLDATRYVREELDDWSSVIILITAHNELKYEALGNRLFLLDFINKFDDCENRLKEDLTRAMNNYNHREKSLSFEYKHVIKKIEFKHIIKIEKEKDSKRCLIVTKYGEFQICDSLNNIHKILDSRFIKISRSTIINLDEIKEYNNAENKITFKNGISTVDISRNFKKELETSVRNI